MATEHTPRHPRGRRLFASTLALVILLAARPSHAAPTYDGHLTLPGARLGGASATLDIVPPAVSGTLTISAATSPASGDYAVTGKQRGVRLIVAGTSSSGTTFKWTGRRPKLGTTYTGVARFKGPAGKVRGKLILYPHDPASSACDDEFREHTMAQVLLPICAACHVPGALAAGTRLLIAPADATVTRANVAKVINTSDPALSLLTRKPVGQLNHGGGVQLANGSPELAILQHWVDLVTSGQCGAVAPPPGGGDAGAQLYADNCASCHGTDARGTAGKPAVLCNRNVHDSVRSGRNSDTGQVLMPPFPILTDADIDLIQAYMDGLCPTATATGADLFVGNCGTCHAPDASGGKGPDIHCARVIGDTVRNGVIGVFGPMPAMMRLTDPEIDKIQDHLDGMCPLGAATGAELWASNCAGCHGDSGQGDGNRRPDIRCSVASRVSNAVRKGRGTFVPVMSSWGTSSLTDAELTSIRAFVAPGCAGTGQALFTSNCATCHGATGTGGQNANGLAGPNIRCKSQTQISTAIASGFGGMPALADMSAGQTTAVVGYLRSGCP